MKKYFVLGLIVVALMAAGVIHFQKDGDELNISIDRGKLKRVSSELIDEGKHLIDEARDEFDERSNRTSDLGDEFETEVRSQTRRFTPSRNR